jgi:hypothetical protein
MAITKGISTQVKNRNEMSKKLENHIVDINKKVTAIEWLEQEFIKLEATIGVHCKMYELLERAKAIENDIEQKWLEYRDYTNNEDAWCFKEWLIEQFKNK